MISSISIVGFIGCASSDIERRLENNFIYQCSVKLYDDLGRKINGADAERICTAAYQLEKDGIRKNAPEVTSEKVIPASTPNPTPNPKSTPSVDLDEVKPEPTPSSN